MLWPEMVAHIPSYVLTRHDRRTYSAFKRPRLVIVSDTTGREAPVRCDLLVRHAHILAMDTQRTVYEDGAVAVRDGVIIAIGSDSEVVAVVDATRVIDAGGGMTHPGFIDLHYHVTMHSARDALSDHAPAPGGARSGHGFGLFANWINSLEPDDEHASAMHASASATASGSNAVPGSTKPVCAPSGFGPRSLTRSYGTSRAALRWRARSAGRRPRRLALSVSSEGSFGAMTIRIPWFGLMLLCTDRGGRATSSRSQPSTAREITGC
jgi:hypothetical protein